jgi:hypothetical protein
MRTWRPSVFPGTTEERDALLSALEGMCACRRGPDGEALVCGPHSLLLNERTVKHLIFYRRWRLVLWPGDLPQSATVTSRTLR